MKCISNRENHFVRLDFMFVENGRIIILEVDEDQHIGYPVNCDSVRPYKIAETLAIEGNQMPIIMIRFNPDAFRINDKLQKIKKKDRYIELIKTIKSYLDLDISFLQLL